MSQKSLEGISNKTVVILGDFLHEGVETTIATLGYTYSKKKLYNLTPKTWRKRLTLIKNLREAGDLVAVILYLPTPVFLYGCHEEFQSIWREMLNEFSNMKSIVFVFEDNLMGKFEYWDYETKKSYSYEDAKARFEVLSELLNYDYNFYYEEPEAREAKRLKLAIENMEDAQQNLLEIKNFLRALYASDVQIAPFRRRSDVTVRIQEFLENVDTGVFLRLYVPNGRYQAEQLNSFLKLFEDYLRRVEGKNFSVDSRKTELGVVYIFRDKDTTVDDQDLNDAIQRFDSFMKLCQSDPKNAETMLMKVGVNPTEAGYVIAKYSKEYQRILMDARHEVERKKLLLSQKLEDELFEMANDNVFSESRPTVMPTSLFSFSDNSGSVIINFQNTAIIDSEVGKILNGNIVYTEEDKQILELIETYEKGLQAIQLKSDLEQLKDKSSPEKEKKTAKQRLTAFLHKVVSTVGNSAVEISTKVLTTYLENLIKGTP